MTNEIDDGGPAMPLALQHMEQPHYQGLSLRDWFAGQALNGLFAGDDVTNGAGSWTAVNAARQSYAIADAMLVARKLKRE